MTTKEPTPQEGPSTDELIKQLRAVGLERSHPDFAEFFHEHMAADLIEAQQTKIKELKMNLDISEASNAWTREDRERHDKEIVVLQTKIKELEQEIDEMGMPTDDDCVIEIQNTMIKELKAENGRLKHEVRCINKGVERTTIVSDHFYEGREKAEDEIKQLKARIAEMEK